MSIVNSRKQHQLRQQFEHGQNITAQLRQKMLDSGLTNEDADRKLNNLTALGSDPKRPWINTEFLRNFAKWDIWTRYGDDVVESDSRGDWVVSEVVVDTPTTT